MGSSGLAALSLGAPGAWEAHSAVGDSGWTQWETDTEGLGAGVVPLQVTASLLWRNTSEFYLCSKAGERKSFLFHKHIENRPSSLLRKGV